MSNANLAVEEYCDLMAGCGAIRQLIQPKDKDLGGFCVRRALPNQVIKSVGPWIFFDHMGPATFSPGEGIDVRPHPHINIATVTYLFDGEILHRDSIGSNQVIRPGDLNLMVTGSGIVHSERELPEVRNSHHSVHGLQLWMALPEMDEETEPAFYHYSADELPKVNIEEVDIRVMMGEAYGVTSPVKTFSPTLYIEAKLNKGKMLVLPNAAQRGLYVVKGDVWLRDTLVQQHTMAIIDEAKDVTIRAERDAQIALVGGDALGHRYVDWNFVSSREERIELAKRQWSERKFPDIPGDSEEYIPYPTFNG
ncbi:pirin family protein [Vibrio parahaemolyticus]|uniref:pirin family protein n=1 Tax=Vibrio alginolyticus TaxID=663 RepID=UPI0023EAE966|nr:pirin family protein [Vibrio alginolyticus]MDF4345086.1 pirin family protein [Vibrio parahaemolyticus]MDF4357364.1 pirin family protein [Vibrio parahaemolyticus]MDF4418887.1 pirin family protein [Vibrio parahaemolyticus]MDF4526779.1 pirin family protein [Vibrio parahaemolyticus]MDF4554032.1 pirin family protein [Vibrio parahaemolyticus]